MELSLAVNNSLLTLHKLGIYCTEPFRIPYAGRCHVCCFDKTGTLTASELLVEGVAVDAAADAGGADAGGAVAAATGASATADAKAATNANAANGEAAAVPAAATYPLRDAAAVPLPASLVIAGCHALVYSSGQLLGDPMEKAALLAAGWSYTGDGHAIRAHALASPLLAAVLPAGASARPHLRILKRFPFSSELQRSAAVIDAGLAYAGLRGAEAASPALTNAARLAGAHGPHVVAKGSPEAIRKLLARVPRGYDETYLELASSGKRVLALATKPALASGGAVVADAMAIKREAAECDLTFCGFLVLHCPAKPESQAVLTSLSTAGHTLQMLTGDNLLTATHAAQTLQLSAKPALLLHVGESGSGSGGGSGGGCGGEPASPPPRVTKARESAKAAVAAGPRSPIERYISSRMRNAPFAVPPAATSTATSTAAVAANGGGSGGAAAKLDTPPPLPTLRWELWKPPPGALPPPTIDAAALTPTTFRDLARTYDVCTDGAAFAALHALGALPSALPYLRVLARMSPAAKELALATHRECGLVTMMCGDGTNDVGALKRSSVGIALVSASLVAPPPPPPPEAMAEAAAASASNTGLRQRGKGKSTGGSGGGGSTAAAKQKEMQERLQRELTASQPSVKLGDASIAAAFTARSASVESCVDIITQGRCTLVTTTQMFKILSLNCLTSAYALSVLHHHGVRSSDSQATASGLTTAALFLFLSFAKPLPKLAPTRPPPSALAPAVWLSVFAQFGAHLRTLIAAFQLAASASAAADEPPPEADADFERSLTNTVLFLTSAAMQLTTFAVNYTGRPYMQPLKSNKGLMTTLLAAAALVLLISSGALPDVADYLELTPLPTAAKPAGLAAAAGDGADVGTELLGLMATDFVLCLAAEKILSRLFRS